MLQFPYLTESLIRQYATNRSFERGVDYYRSGAVLSVIRRGQEVQAEVAGSRYTPYRVHITFGDTGISETFCSCPYDWGGICKHIVAVLLTCLHEPEKIEERPPVESLLSDLDRDQLEDLVLALLESRPDLTEAIEAHLALTAARPSAAETSPRRPPIDPTPFIRQARRIMHSAEEYWHAGDVVSGMSQILDQAQDFIEGGDGNNALTILEVITDEYVKGWEVLDDSDGEASDFYQDLGTAWAEALLTADLSPQERRKWEKRLAAWREELSDYGVEDSLDLPLEAARQGWDYPPLQRVLRGEITRQGAWEGEPPWYADELAEIRLRVLERQGRYQEYLYLAEAEGEMKLYLIMLAKLGRIQEAVEKGLEYAATTGEALALAKALQEQGATQEARRIAEHGLTLSGHKVALARWLRDVAAAAGQTEAALDAAVIAFRDSPNLADYQAVQNLAGDRWPQVREELLAHLRRQGLSLTDKVDILLYEGLVDEAIAVADKKKYDYHLIEKVANAALETRPDWVIRVCLQQAEAIIEERKARHYHRAIRWLEKARAAYRAAGRETEWQEYLDALLERHYRKYSLTPMLKALRTS